MRYALIETAIGTFGIAWTDAGIARVALPGRDRARTELWISRDPAEPGFPDGVLRDLPDRIKRYAEGAREDFTDVPLDLAGIPDFNRQAYAELLKIGYGETTTYGAIARTLGLGEDRLPRRRDRLGSVAGDDRREPLLAGAGAGDLGAEVADGRIREAAIAAEEVGHVGTLHAALDEPADRRVACRPARRHHRSCRR